MSSDLAPTPALTPDRYLQSGQRLLAGSSLVTPTGYTLLLQPGDGNLVVYRPGGSACWDAGRSNPGVHAELWMQNDGNLVLVHNGTPTWWTGTNGRYGSYAELGDDGNFVVYEPHDELVRRPVASTRSC